MKKAQTIMAVLVTAFFAYANNAWAATFESLAAYSEAPQVKKFRDAWAKCGPNGNACPNKKSVAEAIRLRKEAIQDCLTTFVGDAPERVGPCKAAIAATPETFSVKMGEPAKPVRPPVPVVRPPEPEPEPQPEPAEAPTTEDLKDFVTHDELRKTLNSFLMNEVETRVLREKGASSSETRAPSGNMPVLPFVILNLVLIMLNGFLIFRLLDKGKGAKPIEASPAENAEAKALQERSAFLQQMVETVEQKLEILKGDYPQDPLEIERMEKEFDNLDLLRRNIDTTYEQLLAGLKDKADKKLSQ